MELAPLPVWIKDCSDKRNAACYANGNHCVHCERLRIYTVNSQAVDITANFPECSQCSQLPWHGPLSDSPCLIHSLKRGWGGNREHCERPRESLFSASTYLTSPCSQRMYIHCVHCEQSDTVCNQPIVAQLSCQADRRSERSARLAGRRTEQHAWRASSAAVRCLLRTVLSSLAQAAESVNLLHRERARHNHGFRPISVLLGRNNPESRRIPWVGATIAGNLMAVAVPRLTGISLRDRTDPIRPRAPRRGLRGGRPGPSTLNRIEGKAWQKSTGYVASGRGQSGRGRNRNSVAIGAIPGWIGAGANCITKRDFARSGSPGAVPW